MSSAGGERHERAESETESSFDSESSFDPESSFDSEALPRSVHEASDHRLAERLDALETEKVMRRAMELEDSTTDATESFSPADLERIASELGINPEFVRQAIAEVRSTGAQRSQIDRWLLPDELVAQETMTGMDRDQVDRLIHRRMTEYEGLIPTGRLSDGMEWERNRSALIQIRTALTAGGNRMTRLVPGPIQHRVATIRPEEHLVTLAADDTQPVMLAKVGSGIGGLLAIAAVFNTIFGAGLDLILASLVGAATFLAGGILGARAWASSMRRALRKAVTGLTAQVEPTPLWSRKRQSRQDRPGRPKRRERGKSK